MIRGQPMLKSDGPVGFLILDDLDELEPALEQMLKETNAEKENNRDRAS